MKVVALVVLVMAVYASASPAPRKGLLEMSLTDWANVLPGPFGSMLHGVVNAGTSMLDKYGKLEQTIQDKLTAGAVLTLEMIGSLVRYTMDTAASNKLISVEDEKKIMATFNVPDITSGEILKTLEDVDKIVVNGDPKVASEFRVIIKSMIKAKADGIPLVNCRAGVQVAAAHLVIGNKIIAAHGGFLLKGFASYTKLVCTQIYVACPAAWEEIIRGEVTWED